MNPVARIADLERRLANVVRPGVIKEANYMTAKVRVEIGDGLRTTWLPWLTQRAGKDKVWWAPEVGEQVLVFSPGGETNQGFVLPGLFSDANSEPQTVQTKHQTVYEDGTTITYDKAAHKLTASVQGDVDITATGHLQATITGTVNVTSSAGVTIKGTSITLDGPVSATQTIAAQGDVSSSSEVKVGAIKLTQHKHLGVQGGSSTSGIPTA